MSELPIHRRYTVHFAGQVQGVGFRYTAVRIAAEYEVSGFVKNLPDGQVLIVVEGRHQQLDTFIKTICDQMSHAIRNHTVEQSVATGEYDEPRSGGLEIRY